MLYDVSMFVYQEGSTAKVLRRVRACYETLCVVADDLRDPGNIEERADLLIAVEDLIDVATHITEEVRNIAWQYTPTPKELEDNGDE